MIEEREGEKKNLGKRERMENEWKEMENDRNIPNDYPSLFYKIYKKD